MVWSGQTMVWSGQMMVCWEQTIAEGHCRPKISIRRSTILRRHRPASNAAAAESRECVFRKRHFAAQRLLEDTLKARAG